MSRVRGKSTETVSLDARRSTRLQMLWPGEIVLKSGRHDCRVLDISQHGARIATEAILHAGDDGLLLCEGLDTLFEVVRANPDHVAVSFVDESDCEETIQEAGGNVRAAKNRQFFRYLAVSAPPPPNQLSED